MTSRSNDLPSGKQDEEPKEYRGSCLCGLFTYKLTSDPLLSTICYCLNCRKWTGSAFTAGLAFPLSSLRPSEESKAYIRQFIDTSQSGNELQRTFCGECGSSVYTEVPWADVVSVARGGLEEGEKLPAPSTEYWCCRKEEWVDVKEIGESFQRND
ncbi:hypothetical protein M409DRAFT_25841 [Zasmidium cellare ATCC 36951]|uniref:CENP-V/GFA domain-containing protein n=1 Tax=Zasmidium cellare ATCC 36951 TaxID=1080233 RepID=A0A6A6CA06_ZASCE|nr:uncharacterized protein M409DRAFT_25841 [Zasmidium cellare ATCC 36951]KAF2163653.1 hypothetical protein M409DRAFT_25841 [Zasmidium cellare ATCC 36951]